MKGKYLSEAYEDLDLTVILKKSRFKREHTVTYLNSHNALNKAIGCLFSAMSLSHQHGGQLTMKATRQMVFLLFSLPFRVLTR